MITVSTEVIQQSVLPDSFMNGGQNTKHNSNFSHITQTNRKLSDSDFDYKYNTSTPLSHHTYHQYTSEDDYGDEVMPYNQPMSYSVTAANNNNNTDNSTINIMSFEKVDMNALQLMSPTTSKSALSIIIDPIEQKSNHNPITGHIHSQKQKLLSTHINIAISILFAEFEFDRKISVSFRIFDENMTVAQVINQTIHKFETMHPLKRLRSYNAFEYELRALDEDDMNDTNLDEDELDPPLLRSAKICNFMEKTSRPQTVHMVMCCIAGILRAKTVNFLAINPPPTAKKKEVVHLQAARKRAQTMEQLEQENKAIFIRVYVPGPMRESSALLSIHKHDEESKTLRDLFVLLNRKRKSDTFNSLYFDFYYKHATKQYGSISNGVRVCDLLHKELMILPKILSNSMGDINEQEAFQFELVKLANECKQYKAFKIDKYRTSKKKAFLLEIDRYRFVKTSLETSNVFSSKNRNQMKVPIAIQDIVCVFATEKCNGHQKHHNRFTITYNNPSTSTKTKTFQMPNAQIRDEIVDKLNFLCVLRRLQG